MYYAADNKNIKQCNNIYVFLSDSFRLTEASGYGRGYTVDT
jgi:hypothetical protein